MRDEAIRQLREEIAQQEREVKSWYEVAVSHMRAEGWTNPNAGMAWAQGLARSSRTRERLQFLLEESE